MVGSRMHILQRRSLLAAFAALGGMADLPRAIAQVGSGGTGMAPPAPSSIGSADVVIDRVTLRRGGQAGVPLGRGDKLMQGDQIETGEASEVHIVFDDGGYLALRPNSGLRIDRYVVTGDATDVAALTLINGALRSVTGWIGKLDQARYRIAAGSASVGVRGTDHEVVLVRPQDSSPDAEPGVHDRVNEGATVVRNAGAVVNVEQGAAAYAARGVAPVHRAAVPAFFDRLRTGQEALVENHARTVHQHIEGRLRQLGKLRPGERFDQYRERLRPGRGLRGERRAGLADSANASAQSTAQEARAQRIAAREQRRRNRPQRAEGPKR